MVITRGAVPVRVGSPPGDLRGRTLTGPADGGAGEKYVVKTRAVFLCFSIDSSGREQLSAASRLGTLGSRLYSGLVKYTKVSVASLRTSLIYLSVVMEVVFL